MTHRGALLFGTWMLATSLGSSACDEGSDPVDGSIAPGRDGAASLDAGRGDEPDAATQHDASTGGESDSGGPDSGAVMGSCSTERPSASNTGAPEGIERTMYTGPAHNTEAGLVLDGYEFPALADGSYTFTGDRVTLRNCVVHAGVVFRGDDVRLERCDVEGAVALSGTAGASIVCNDLRGTAADGIHVTSDTGRVSDVVVADNYMHDFMPSCGAHSDGMQVRGVDGLEIRHNVIDMGPWREVCGSDVLNAALFFQDANGGNRDLTIAANYLNGAGYTVRFGPAPNTRFVDNRFGRDEEFGLVLDNSRDGDIVEDSGNVRDDTGEPIR